MVGSIKLYPSSAERWVHCFGAPSMEARFPETERNEIAEEGKASHWAATFGRMREPMPAVGTVAPNGVILTEEMLAGAQIFRDAVNYSGNLHIEEPAVANGIHWSCRTRPDLWYYQTPGAVLHVFDYKYGWGIVEPYENWQCICYAAAAVEAINIWRVRYAVCVHIVQPRPYHAQGPHRTWTFNDTELEAYVARLKHAAECVYEPDPVLLTGNHCCYCRARHACPSAQRMALLCLEYSETASSQELPPDALGLELRTLRRAMEAIKYRMTGLESQAISIINSGGFVPGFTLENGVGRAEWNKSPSEIFMLGDMFGKNLRTEQVPVTPAQARKMGLPAEIVKAYSSQKGSGMKLVETTNSFAAKAFKEIK